MTLTITADQEKRIRSDETSHYIDRLRLQYHQASNQVERSRISEMIGAAESVFAIWVTPMEHFWEE